MVGVGGWVDVSLCHKDWQKQTDEMEFDENGGRCGFSGFRAGKKDRTRSALRYVIDTQSG